MDFRTQKVNHFSEIATPADTTARRGTIGNKLRREVSQRFGMASPCPPAGEVTTRLPKPATAHATRRCRGDSSSRRSDSEFLNQDLLADPRPLSCGADAFARCRNLSGFGTHV